MPNVSILVPETNQSVLRPVVMGIVRDLMYITKIPKETSILYPEDGGKIAQPGSTIASSEEERSVFPNMDKILIEVDESDNSASILSTAIARPEHLPVFLDDEIGVFIKPIYSYADIQITFKFMASSRSQAIRWRDDIKMRTSAGRDINLHKLTYHYIIPDKIIEILKEIHTLREKQAGYGDEFEKYLLDNSTGRFTEVTNLGGSNVRPAIGESQMRVQGIFNFEFAPEKIENDSDNNGWVGSFTYKFSFDKPVACNLRYPAMVHNTLIKKSLMPSEHAYDIDEHFQTFSLSLSALNFFEAQLQTEKAINFKSSIVIPPFDEFIPASIPSGTVSIFSALCQLNNQDKKNLVNLKELGEVVLDSDVMTFIRESEWCYLTKPYKSIFNVALYKSMYLSAWQNIEVTAQLDVKAIADLSLRTSHRVRLSIVADLGLLDKQALERLKAYPKAAVKILSAISEAVRNYPGQFQNVTKDDLANIARNRASMKTVQIASIIAMRPSATV